MRTTQRKGDIGVTQAICKFTALGCDVSLPLTESAPYDLIVDDGELHRVQVKYTSRDEVDLRRIHTNARGYVVKKNDSQDYDWLYVYHSDGQSYIQKECLENRSSIRVGTMTAI